MEDLFRFLAAKVIEYQDPANWKTKLTDKEKYAMNNLCWNTLLDILEKYYCCATDAYDDVKLGFEEIMPTIPADIFAMAINHIGPSALIRPNGSRTKLACLLADNSEYAESLLVAGRGLALLKWEHSRIWHLIHDYDNAK